MTGLVEALLLIGAAAIVLFPKALGLDHPALDENYQFAHR